MDDKRKASMRELWFSFFLIFKVKKILVAF